MLVADASVNPPLVELGSQIMEKAAVLESSRNRIETRRLLVNGVERNIRSISIDKQVFLIERGLLNLLRLEDEWYEDVKDPHALVAALTREPPVGVDLITFWQRPPRTTPIYDYHTEPEAVAALAVNDYDHWLSKQITPQSRNKNS